jgi:hypothetical protein
MNILKSTTKNVKKRGGERAQNYFIHKYVIESYKTRKFYYQKGLV